MHDGRVAARRPSNMAELLSVSPFVGRAGDARWVAEAGRGVAIWLPVFVLVAGFHSTLAGTVLEASFVGAVWFLALQSAFRAVPLTLGPAIPAAVGTITGLVAVSAFNSGSPAFGCPRRRFS